MSIRNPLLAGRTPFAALQFDDATPPAGGGDAAPAADPAPAEPAAAPAAGDVKPFLSGDDGDSDGTVDSGDAAGGDGAGTPNGPADPDGAPGEEAPGDDDAGDEPKDVVPDEYADFELPEGVTLDAEVAEDLKTTAKELGLSQEKAQKIVELGVKQQAKIIEAITQQYVDQRNTWRDAAQNDQEYGGDKFRENLAHGKAAIDAFGSPELKSYLDETGLGDHPEFLRFAISVGKANSEHDFVNSGRPARAKPFYDHPTSRGTDR